MIDSRHVVFLTLCVSVALTGCKALEDNVIAASGTTIGVAIKQNPATQVPEAKLGYNRGELAIVPTSRTSGGQGGAQATANVIMEIKHSGIFDWGASSGVYSRLAVGEHAVKQKGAAYMFARGSSGEVSPQLASALNGIPESSADIEGLRSRIRSAYTSSKQGEFNTAAEVAGLVNYSNAMSSQSATVDQLKAMIVELEKDSDIKAKLSGGR